MTSTNDRWGRVDEDGTVYVRTAEGERVVGSWQAGAPEEALAFFRRKYDALVTEIDLLEQRLDTTDLPTSQARQGIQRLRDNVAAAHAVGDLDELAVRLDTLEGRVERRRAELEDARKQAKAEARDVKERIVAEAERVATEGTHWKAGGERLRQLVEEWKAAERIDKPTDSALWKRMSGARNTFAKRRKAYFAGLEEQRGQVRERKEQLIAEAEELTDSTDWGPTGGRFRDLMRQWKAAGRAGRDVDDELWSRFKTAQDHFFQARSAAFAERDAELAEHAGQKQRLLAEAEQILPVTDLRSARAALRSVQQRWEAIGPVPRDSRDRVEGRLRKIEDAVRQAEESRWRKSNPEAVARAETTVARLRTSIEQLERRLEDARAKGRDKDARETEEALTARRSWLAEAERTLGELSS